MAEARGVDGVLCDGAVVLLAPESLVVVDAAWQQLRRSPITNPAILHIAQEDLVLFSGDLVLNCCLVV